MLEHAVRWVIIIIIFVFDPLAVLLLLASQYSFEYHRRERKQTEDGDKIIDADKSTEPPTPEIARVEPEEAPPPTIFDQYVLTELNKTLSQELELQREIKDSYIKMYEDEERDNDALHIKIDHLEQELKEIQTEHDRLSAAYGHEMERAEELAYKLVQAHQSVTETQPAQPVVEEIVVEQVVEPTVDSTEITVDTPETVTESQSSEIQTYGVTNQAIFYHPSEEYVNFEGKQISINALKGLRPDLLLSPGDPVNQILFGNAFPKYSRVGDIYIRTDAMPHIVYKFNGKKWIEVDKTQNTSYVQYIPYLQYLIQKCESGEYDTDYLTDAEREEIESHLSSK
jgi:hypothetical protein